jgi:DNA-binding HxlR family transcriptional regulator
MGERTKGLAAGEQALSCLGAPLSFNILKALTERTYDAEGLRRAAGSPPTSTMRLYMREMEDLRVVRRTREKKFRGSGVCEITPAGEQLLRVGEVLDRWLQEAPYGPVSLGTPAAKSNVKALLGGWSAHAIRSLAAKPLRLTELHRFVPWVSYPMLERRLGAMNHVGLIERYQEGGRGTPYKATTWLRRAVAPLAVAIGWEGKCIPELAAPVRRADIEALFLLLVPLLELPQSASGVYRLVVELRDGAQRDFAGVSVGVEDGKVVSCTTRLQAAPTTVISGDPLAWLNWIVFREQKGLTVEGNSRLARSLGTRTRKALTSQSEVTIMRARLK